MGRRAAPADRQQAGRVGQLAQLHHRASSGRNDANKVSGAKVFINWLSEHSLDWAQGRPGAGPQGRPRGRRVQGADRRSRRSAPELEYAAFPPAVPGLGEVITTFYTAFNEAVLGKKPPKQALDDGVAKANKLLEDNRKKYGS